MTDFQPLEIEPGRVLAVAAHPDDLEYGAAAAVAQWTDAGHEVTYLLVTRGEAGIDGMAPADCARVREAEERAGAAVVGVRAVEFLDHPDGVVQHSLALRRDVARAIRRHRPDLVLVPNHRETWGPGRLNSPDHRAVGGAVLDAIGDAGNRWIFPELLGEGHEPWGGVRHALVVSSPLSTHAIDVRDGLERGLASLREHRAYLAGLGEHPMADPEFVRWFLEQAGERFGGRPCVPLELFEF